MATTEDGDRRSPLRLYSADGRRYWSAERSTHGAKHVQEPPVVEGSTIWFAPEVGGVLPLWDDSGWMGDDPAWLEEHLNLDAQLVADLRVWGYAYDNRSAWTDSWEAWKREGQRLVEAVRAALPAELNFVDQRHASDK